MDFTEGMSYHQVDRWTGVSYYKFKGGEKRSFTLKGLMNPKISGLET